MQTMVIPYATFDIGGGTIQNQHQQQHQVGVKKMTRRQRANITSPLNLWVRNHPTVGLHPTKEQREELARQNGVTEVQVSRWFANRRRKEKESGTANSECLSSPTNSNDTGNTDCFDPITPPPSANGHQPHQPFDTLWQQPNHEAMLQAVNQQKIQYHQNVVNSKIDDHNNNSNQFHHHQQQPQFIPTPPALLGAQPIYPQYATADNLAGLPGHLGTNSYNMEFYAKYLLSLQHIQQQQQAQLKLLGMIQQHPPAGVQTPAPPVPAPPQPQQQPPQHPVANLDMVLNFINSVEPAVNPHKEPEKTPLIIEKVGVEVEEKVDNVPLNPENLSEEESIAVSVLAHFALMQKRRKE